MFDKQANLSKRIIEIRKSRGFSQQEIAERTGLKRPTIANIERGDQRPSIDFLILFSRATGVSIDEIAGLIEKPAHEIDQLITALTNDPALSKSNLESINQIRLYIKQIEEEKSIVDKKYLTAIEELKDIQQKLIKHFKIKS